MIRQDINSLNMWFADRGDYTHNINYELNDESVIIDLGGYHGLWVDEILKKINPHIPNILLVEPVPEYYNFLVDKFKNYEKIKVINFAVSTNQNEEIKKLFLSNDGSSTNFNSNSNISIEIKTKPIDKILSDNNLNKVDLLQINIEGDEYGLMEYMIETNLVSKFKNIQIQFHLGIENDIIRRNNIHSSLLSKGFKNKFDYPFVWESWENSNF